MKPLADWQQSMILTALAKGEPLCCDVGEVARLTIAPRSRRARAWIAACAYSCAGCREQFVMANAEAYVDSASYWVGLPVGTEL